MNQRANLAFLLLHTNQVVATSDLMQVLWPNGGAPATARKVLQNSISALRGVLARGAIPADVVSLVSQAPGYMLRMAPEALDLARFRILADQGRSAMAAGQPESAARSLRAALRRATPHRPLVAVAENLHHAGSAVPACVGEVIRAAGRIPLLVVLTARAGPESLWPGWNAAVPWSTTVMV